MPAGFKKSICIERTKKAKPGVLSWACSNSALLRAHQPQMIGAPALHEAQLARVIDDAGKLMPDIILPAG
jgi:hypothetical protein